MVEERHLSEDDVALVIRRAAELDSLTSVNGTSRVLDEATVLDVGREVGLSEVAIRRALDELRGGLLRPPARAGLLGPSAVTARRVVNGPPARVATDLRHALSRQLFEAIRNLETMMFFSRRADFAANLTRGFKKPRLRHVRSVEASLVPVGEGLVEVHLRADLGQPRTAALFGLGFAGFGATAGTAAGVGLGIAVSPPLLLIIAPSLALSAAIALGSRHTYARAVELTQLALDGILDGL